MPEFSPHILEMCKKWEEYKIKKNMYSMRRQRSGEVLHCQRVPRKDMFMYFNALCRHRLGIKRSDDQREREQEYLGRCQISNQSRASSSYSESPSSSIFNPDSTLGQEQGSTRFCERRCLTRVLGVIRVGSGFDLDLTRIFGPCERGYRGIGFR